MIAEDFGPVYTRARARARDRKHSGLRLREHVRARPVCTRGQKTREGAASAVRYRHDHRHRGQTSETQELFDADKRPGEKCGLAIGARGPPGLQRSFRRRMRTRTSAHPRQARPSLCQTLQLAGTGGLKHRLTTVTTTPASPDRDDQPRDLRVQRHELPLGLVEPILQLRFSSRWHACRCRLRAAVRSFTSPSRAVCSHRSAAAAPPALLRPHHLVRRRADPRRQRLESRRVVAELCRLPGVQPVNVQMRLRDAALKAVKCTVHHRPMTGY